MCQIENNPTKKQKYPTANNVPSTEKENFAHNGPKTQICLSPVKKDVTLNSETDL